MYSLSFSSLNVKLYSFSSICAVPLISISSNPKNLSLSAFKTIFLYIFSSVSKISNNFLSISSDGSTGENLSSYK